MKTLNLLKNVASKTRWLTLLVLMFTYTSAWAEWTRVTSIAELTAGGTFIMGYEATAKSGVIVPLRNLDCNATTGANGYFNTGTTAGSSASGTIKMDTVTYSAPYEIYISSPASGKINIQRALNGNFYGASSAGSSKNTGRLYTSGNSNETNLTPEWASETNNQFKLTAAVSGSYKYLKYNTGSPRFAFYNSAGEKIVFYKKDTKVDVMCAKGFGGYTTNSFSAQGTDRSAVANLVNTSGSTYAMQVFNGSNGQVKGSGSGAANFSCRNTTTHDGYYISKVTLTVKTGTIDGSTSGRSIVYFGTSAYSNPNTTAPSGTYTSASPASSGQTTLTWTNTNTSVSHFILYNLKTANSAYSAEYANALVVEWTKKPACSNPTINTHPSGNTYALNATATAMSVSATKNGSGPALTYQWYSNTTNNNTGGSSISGATGSTYTPPTTSAGTTYYYCIVSSGDCSATSNTATVTVTGPVITVSSSSVNLGIKKVGGTYTGTFTVSGSNLEGNITLTKNTADADYVYYSIDPISITPTAGTVSAVTVTITYSPTTNGVHNVTNLITLSSTNAADVNVSVSAAGVYEDTFIDVLQETTGYTEASPHTERSTYTTPTLADKDVATSGTCEQQHWHFMGWITQAKYDAGTAISDGDLQTPTSANNTTYYAVWAKGSTTPSTSYAAITSGLETNKYVIAYSYNGGTQIVLKNTADGTNASTMLEGYNLSLSSSKYSNPDAAYIWELQAQADGSYYIYNTTIEKYVNATTTALTLSSTPTKFTITYDSSNSRWTIQLKDNTSYYVHGYVSGSAYDFRCTTSGSGAKYRVYLYKNESQTTYSDYVTQCCANNVTLSGGSPANGTVVFSPAGPVATCSGAQNVTMTITPAAGYKLTAFSASGVSASGGSPVTSGDASKSAQNIALTFAQDASGTYTASATFTAMTDHYKDQLHNTTNYTGDGKAFNATYTVPTLASTTPDSGCEGEHYKFVGWVEDTYVKSDGTLNSGYTLITGGSAGTASEKTYVAIWAKEL